MKECRLYENIERVAGDFLENSRGGLGDLGECDWWDTIGSVVMTSQQVMERGRKFVL